MKYLKDIETFTSNKTVFCGIDIHLKNWNLCFMCDGQLVEKINITGNADRLIQHASRFYHRASQVHFVYEAGFSGFHLYRKLEAAGFECTITPANRVPSVLDKVKTDKRDAQKLAQYLSGGLLKAVFVPPLTVEAERQVLRMRNSYQKKLTQVKNQIKSLLNLHGIIWSDSDGNKWTKRYLAWLETVEFENENYRFILDQHLASFRFNREKIALLTRRIRDLSKNSTYHGNYMRLTACKGIGLITAMTFLLELHDVVRFPSAEKFCSYLGLTSSQYSSGEHVRMGHITREGNSHVRRVLVESAWTVIRHDPFLREKYDRIRSRGTNGKKAIVAVARSLAVRLRRCLIDQVPYELGVC
ncbi:IS110 family transposase [candidate division KSB1 bacterium]|nr:IS110 family transposase [candidate division KSB1 bacterium]